MGLDMYLTGERHFDVLRTMEQKIIAERYSLGYWRKHPNLHGYFVEQFSGGRDECCEIELNSTLLRQVLHAVQTDQLPTTSGFFFGTSTGSEKSNDIAVLTAAIAWLEQPDEQAYRTATYHASW